MAPFPASAPATKRNGKRRVSSENLDNAAKKERFAAKLCDRLENKHDDNYEIVPGYGIVVKDKRRVGEDFGGIQYKSFRRNMRGVGFTPSDEAPFQGEDHGLVMFANKEKASCNQRYAEYWYHGGFKDRDFHHILRSMPYNPRKNIAPDQTMEPNGESAEGNRCGDRAAVVVEVKDAKEANTAMTESTSSVSGTSSIQELSPIPFSDFGASPSDASTPTMSCDEGILLRDNFAHQDNDEPWLRRSKRKISPNLDGAAKDSPSDNEGSMTFVQKPSWDLSLAAGGEDCSDILIRESIAKPGGVEEMSMESGTASFTVGEVCKDDDSCASVPSISTTSESPSLYRIIQQDAANKRLSSATTRFWSVVTRMFYAHQHCAMQHASCRQDISSQVQNLQLATASYAALVDQLDLLGKISFLTVSLPYASSQKERHDNHNPSPRTRPKAHTQNVSGSGDDGFDVDQTADQIPSPKIPADGQGGQLSFSVHSFVRDEFQSSVPDDMQHSSQNANQLGQNDGEICPDFFLHREWFKKKLQDLLTAHYENMNDGEEFSAGVAAIEAVADQLEFLRRVTFRSVEGGGFWTRTSNLEAPTKSQVKNPREDKLQQLSQTEEMDWRATTSPNDEEAILEGALAKGKDLLIGNRDTKSSQSLEENYGGQSPEGERCATTTSDVRVHVWHRKQEQQQQVPESGDEKDWTDAASVACQSRDGAHPPVLQITVDSASRNASYRPPHAEQRQEEYNYHGDSPSTIVPSPSSRRKELNEKKSEAKKPGCPSLGVSSSLLFSALSDPPSGSQESRPDIGKIRVPTTSERTISATTKTTVTADRVCQATVLVSLHAANCRTCNPIAIVSIPSNGTCPEQEIGRTELLEACYGSPWTQAFEVNFTCFHVAVYALSTPHSKDALHLLGKTRFDVETLLTSPTGIKCSPLPKQGLVFARVQLIEQPLGCVREREGQSLRFTFEGHQLKLPPSSFGSSTETNFFYEVSHVEHPEGSDNRRVVVLRSESIPNMTDPKWAPGSVSLQRLCSNDRGRLFRVSIFSLTSKGSKRLIGDFEGSVKSLLQMAIRKRLHPLESALAGVGCMPCSHFRLIHRAREAGKVVVREAYLETMSPQDLHNQQGRVGVVQLEKIRRPGRSRPPLSTTASE